MFTSARLAESGLAKIADRRRGMDIGRSGGSCRPDGSGSLGR